MTEQQRNLIRALWFLAGEIRAGHQVSDDKLFEWETAARNELERTRPPTLEEQTQSRHDAWDRAYANIQAIIRRPTSEAD
jgi:hypothetical protein